MMNEKEKQAIATKLACYVERFESQNKASKSLKNVSSATISQVLNYKWDLIADEMWRNIASQIGYSASEWVSVETGDFRLLNTILERARNSSTVFAVVGDAGTGKTFALRNYAETHKRAYLLQCNEFWNRKTFMQELLSAMGRDYSGYTVNEMMGEVVRALKTQQHPLIIMDEADKLSDQVLYFFITLYNQLEDHCAIVLCATDHLAKRIKRGLKLNKKGYKEIYSRIGRKFIELEGLNTSDITSVCVANGITDKVRIREVIEDSEYDLRRVKRKIQGLKYVLSA
ncbi:AAA family ATPase [Alkaliflexus imshenetskii]|uniref:AAA family ATPase n=1 Tax=Alkaliflexus imshenetskii TaxID=286730 RepID=UPI0004B63C7C|nr:AAA family ATPase [Alkaliflexus imshenetskii]